jgi:hypothetical protein
VVAAERMLVDDAPERLMVAVTIARVGADVVNDAPAHTVEVAVADVIARDQLVERRKGFGRECPPVGEGPRGFDELQRGTKIAAA